MIDPNEIISLLENCIEVLESRGVERGHPRGIILSIEKMIKEIKDDWVDR